MMLEVNGIDVFYGNVQALWDVSFRVERGEIVTIIGANGAGKSTTLRAVSGLMRPRKGQVVFEGIDITRIAPNDRVGRGIVLVPEARQLWPAMSVLENLEMGAYKSAARRVRATTLENVFTMFPVLKERLRQKAGTLSGGEQQMCAIGRGLMACPRLLLLDEPALGLAPMMVREVFSSLRTISQQGVTIVLVEQNVPHALALADRAFVLETGRVTLSGPARDLVNDVRIRDGYLGAAAV
ncbi:MAG TPA: ABC transporter ATP-binding protein [Thermoanaerobaculia bacterium]